ncbi:MaoC family dehydratase [Amycolatopsis saalfeldensis]|uniref:Acyl dehydratase n=1 Tax=Amycolatopsis saalfeldensis TaxID=394193 RepID=A0A1H8Y981_9PSEU|nr:MaoC family dehydratase [Amycolatopsis saalfeldensis]SEP48699.1 Acyl dehydratase [Amycolatopsis saalfeldensis]
MLELTVAELAEARDLDLGASAWRRVAQARVDTFADATDDHQWIHVDAERAAGGPFGGTIAHGYLTLSLVPAMFKEILVVKDHARGLNYGLDQVRFTSPVPVGSEIRLAGVISSAARRDDGGVRYRVALRIEIKGRERPAMVGEAIFVTYAR